MSLSRGSVVRISRLRLFPTLINPIFTRHLQYHCLNRQYLAAKKTHYGANIVSNMLLKREYASSTDGRDIPEEILNLPLQTYHVEADSFLNNLLEKLEMVSDEYPNDITEVDLSHGVMTLEVPAIGAYVINKQPPNKQIWFASPISGPDRFDFYKKQWISLRNGNKLLDVLQKELNDAIPGTEVNLKK
ncbi:ferroxidase NDAI_0B03410 [Naumovozyma dairenensis CBS 421]|uniref:ferroxidase n=1 Tax=Naumovozyma dairenensis (strain ATCC 10597 / BCRC 20456 / CBS 421 / NBRC 0211 / NRRL Y-12639) TaxID=1071378 RepID=G0W6G4_NAUDC|nr:hypothetical protein NDAI_0B03410 [Naumovozyma dairenensis CBS 421]CCD23375.1 hypothetical protein NDAI_0B03410 [Naumovozyma dairenensis CBS 421]